jgi:hypothetical protein
MLQSTVWVQASNCEKEKKSAISLLCLLSTPFPLVLPVVRIVLGSVQRVVENNRLAARTGPCLAWLGLNATSAGLEAGNVLPYGFSWYEVSSSHLRFLSSL